MTAILSRILISALPLLLISSVPPSGAAEGRGPDAAVVSQEADEAKVTELSFDFMKALSTHDTETLAGLLAPQAMLYSVREGETGPVYGARTGADFLQGIGGDQRDLLERIWDPAVEVSGRVAMVWAPYDFHLDGTFTHCGIDVLTFLKIEDGWKVTSITYNVVRDGCAPSPLGAPGG